MKKKTLLSFIAASMSLGLVSCGMFDIPTGSNASSEEQISSSEVTNDDPEIRRVYDAYVLNGGTLSYDEWLKTIKGEKGDTGSEGPQGPQGEKGDKGDKGDTGAQGEQGQRGASLLTGETEPSNDLGEDGDSYIDYSTWNFYVKQDGQWVYKGTLKEQTPVEHVHEWGDWYESSAPGCEYSGEIRRDCECGASQYNNVEPKGHDFQYDESLSRAPTCESSGEVVYSCVDCGMTTVTNMIPATGHSLVYGMLKEPTCTSEGIEIYQCTDCGMKGQRTVRALDHIFEITDWYGTPSCTEPSTGRKTCSRCGYSETFDDLVLGHDIQLVGGDTEPAPGRAPTRLYSCVNEGCGLSYMGFRATEVSDESKQHLVFGEDGGARFWGRPIGNAMELDESGSADRDNHEGIFDKTVEGDFFEYVFDLTEEQAAKLNSCKLYCDAKPSDYMNQNDVDFWKVKGDASDDWTYGMYIDDAPEHLNEDGTGKIIEDFRYVLYVDGQLKQMDYSIDTPVSRGNPRGEYALPYTFNLHKGTNTIRLTMSGGYRSTFYNFTFRPYEAPAEPETPEHTHEGGDWTTTNEATCDTAGKKIGTCTCGVLVVETIPAKGHTWGAEGEPVAKDGESTYTVSTCSVDSKRRLTISADAGVGENKISVGGRLDKNASKTYSWKFTAPAGMTKAHIVAAVSVNNVAAYGYSYYTGKNGGASAVTLPDGKTNTSMTVNGAPVTMPTSTWEEMGNTKGEFDFEHSGRCDYGEFNLVEGTNEFTLSCSESFAPKYFAFYVIEA